MVCTAQKKKFSIEHLFIHIQFPAEFVTFTEEILNEKFQVFFAVLK